jgi:hypothetical protein
MPDGVDEGLLYGQMHSENIILAKTIALQI